MQTCEDKDTTAINTRPFESVLEDFQQFLVPIAKNSCKQSKMFDLDDLKQELNMVLWKMYKSYGDKKQKDFLYLTLRSCKNRLATIFRDKAMYVNDHSASLDELPVGTEEFVNDVNYNDEIKDILLCVSDETFEVMAMRLGSVDGRVSKSRMRLALNEVKEIL